MSNRGQKTTSNEGSPTAKARRCRVAREQRSEEILFTKFGISGQSANPDEVVLASWKLVQEDPNQTESDERKIF